MKLPRDVSGAELSRLLVQFGYTTTRQTGSHLRLTTTVNGEHHVTIPQHSPLKLGTLSQIISEIAAHLGMTKEEILAGLLRK